MNPYERQILNDAEEQVFQTQQEFNEATETGGIRPPPDIEETESVLEPQLFGMWFGGQPESEAFGAPSSQSFIEGACCAPDGSCSVITRQSCSDIGGTYLGDNTSCSTSLDSCPSTMQVKLLNVLIDCGCIGDPSSNCSIELTDVSFNNHFFQLEKSTNPLLCPGSTCYYQTHHLFPATFQIRFREWQPSNVCSGSPIINNSSFQGFVNLALISGLWYFLAWSGISNCLLPSRQIFFYGTAPSLLCPMTNLLSCTGPGTFDNAMIECVFGSPLSCMLLGHGGTANFHT